MSLGSRWNGDSALACGVPVITRRAAAPENPVEQSPGGRMLSGWSADEFARVCQELLAAPATLAALRRSGHAYLVAEHSMKPFRERLAVVID
jgi:glycosyltransferase involved in cell wall biosynthesis